MNFFLYLGVMKKYIADDRTSQVAHGEIVGIYKHRATSKQRKQVLVQVEWFTNCGTLYNGRMQQVKRDPKSAWNRENRFEFFDSSFYCQEAGFWPRNLRAPTGKVLLCITRPLNRLHAQQKHGSAHRVKCSISGTACSPDQA